MAIPAIDTNPKSAPLPSNLRAVPVSADHDMQTGDVAVAADGTTWLTSRAADGGSVFSIAPGATGKAVAHKLPDIPQDRGPVQPAHITLETKPEDGTTVVAVWVSDLHNGFVYRLDGKGANPETIDVGGGAAAPLRGIAWDATSKHVWVADQSGLLRAIDPRAKKENKNLSVTRTHGLSYLVAAAGGVWFTEYAAGKVSFLDGSKNAAAKDRVKEFDFGITTKDQSDNTLRPSSFPAGLAVDSTNKRVWVLAGSAGGIDGSLWYADITEISQEKPRPHKVASLGEGTEPNDIAVDPAGYLWVTLYGKPKALQLTNTGLLVEEYPLDQNGAPAGVAYDNAHDQVWICDGRQANRRVLRLKPIDQIAAASKVQISSKPTEGYVPQGEKPTLEIAVHDDNDRPMERHVVLTVDQPSIASFAGLSGAVVKTDKQGNVSVGAALADRMLKVATGAATGAHFEVKATTRGLTAPVSLYKGTVGEPMTIQPDVDKPETAALGQEFLGDLAAKVTGRGGNVVNAEVVFTIESGKDCAVFRQAQAKATEYVTTTGTDGIARAGLHALDKPGDVQVSVHVKAMGVGSKKNFAIRHVVPLPDTITGSNYMGISVGEASAPYTVTVTSKYPDQNHHTPVPHVTVQVTIQPVTGAQDAYVMEKGKNEDEEKKKPNREGRIVTDESGVAKFGNGADAWIVSPSSGSLDVHFEVIQPTTSKLEKKLTAEVQR